MVRTTSLTYKIILVGDSRVGKTCLIERFCQNVFNSNQITTISCDSQKKTIMVDRRSVTLEIMDTVGQEEYNAIPPSYYREARGAMIVFDITKEDSFDRCQHWIKQVIESAHKDVEILLLGNKKDSESNRKVLFAQANVLAIQYGIKYLETSAMTGASVSEAFHVLAQNVKHRLERQQLEESFCCAFHPDRQGDGVVVLRNEPDQEMIRRNRGCCK